MLSEKISESCSSERTLLLFISAFNLVRIILHSVGAFAQSYPGHRANLKESCLLEDLTKKQNNEESLPEDPRADCSGNSCRNPSWTIKF